MRIRQHGGLVDIDQNGGIIATPFTGQGLTVTGKLNTALDSGANDAYAITLTPALASYITGQVLWFKANTANTGAATLNVDGLGAKAIKKVAGGVTTVLADNDIRAGQYVCVVYDGTNFQMLSASGNADAGGDVNGVAAGYKIARGEHTQVAASDTVVSGLATVISVVVSPRTRTVKQLFFNGSPGNQSGAPAAGSFLITAQKPTAVNDVTPVAATDFTDNIAVDWIAVGT